MFLKYIFKPRINNMKTVAHVLSGSPFQLACLLPKAMSTSVGHGQSHTWVKYSLEILFSEQIKDSPVMWRVC